MTRLGRLGRLDRDDCRNRVHRGVGLRPRPTLKSVLPRIRIGTLIAHRARVVVVFESGGVMKKLLKKFLWLFAGLIVGIGLSSTFADTRTPASYRFKVVAVSTEDAEERAANMMKDGELKRDLNTDGLISASVPKCEEVGNDYACETRLTYRL